MAEQYYGSITLLKRDAEKPEIKKLLAAEFNGDSTDIYEQKMFAGESTEMYEAEMAIDEYPERRETILVTYWDSQATNGCFDLEDDLVSLNIPFDRDSEADYRAMAETRVFRPKKKGREAVDTVYLKANDGHTFVSMTTLKSIFHKNITIEEKLAQIQKTMDDLDVSKYPLVDEY